MSEEFALLSHKRQSLFFQSSLHLKMEHIGCHRCAYFRLVFRMQQFSPFLTLLHGARGFECQKSLLRHHTKGRASFLVIFSPEGGAHWAAQVCIFQTGIQNATIFPIFLHCCMVQEDLNVRRVCSVITQKAGPLFLPSRLFQLPQVHSRQVCLYIYICSQIHTWAYLTVN